MSHHISRYNELIDSKISVRQPLQIAIIVPVKDIESYLEKCLSSIMCQTFKKWVCFLIDDCSTDSSGLICDQFSATDSRFKAIHLRNNIGLPRVREKGIRIVREKGVQKVIFVDGDDWLNHNALEVLNDYFQDDTDIVYGGFSLDYSTSMKIDYSTLGRRGFYSCNDHNLLDILIPNSQSDLPTHVSVWGVLYKTELFDNIDWKYNRVKMGEDLRLHLQLLMYAKKVFNTAESIYHYRQREQSMTVEHAKPSTDVLDFLISLKKHFFKVSDLDYKRFIRIYLRAWILYLARQDHKILREYLKNDFHQDNQGLETSGIYFSKLELSMLKLMLAMPALGSNIIRTGWKIMKFYQKIMSFNRNGQRS